MAFNPVYQTKAEFLTKFRARFSTATKADVAKMATWLLNSIEAGDFTDLQVRTVFNLSAAEYTAMKNRMTNLRTYWVAIDSAAGQ